MSPVQNLLDRAYVRVAQLVHDADFFHDGAPQSFRRRSRITSGHGLTRKPGPGAPLHDGANNSGASTTKLS